MCFSGWWVWPGLGPAAEALFFASPKKSAQKKGEPDALSLRFASGTLRCSVRAGSAQTCPLRGLRTCAALIRPALRYSPAHDGGRRERGHFLRMLGWRGPSPQPFPQRGEGVKSRLARGGVRSRLCRVAGLSSAAAWGAEIRMSEGRAADKFANFPHDASSARKPAGPRTSARLSFAFFSLAKQRKEGRPPGRDPAKPTLRREQSQRPR
ncbi:hypothetical protein J2W49_003136 [Hydrogenophaga palleronii]|uniref:Uncharacterized protein n=1 Tax=Hydrogenophaga palleronii TaxID=65655 RepID=A0ABU1WPG0_9BURK|nr:hypothetical protein [Hydrogenophaga palleronii]